jgi:hypothetical protein
MRACRVHATALILCVLLLGGCGPYGDGAYASRQHRKEVERRTAGMRAATAQVTRGEDLAGAALVEVLAGRTMVQRYESFPNGQRGKFLQYRHFAADGSLLVVNNWLEPSGTPPRGDWWKVEGERVCTLHNAFSQTPSCYRVAREDDGTIQWYVDNPGQDYHGLLTIVAREWLDGPPPPVQSVLVSPPP